MGIRRRSDRSRDCRRPGRWRRETVRCLCQCRWTQFRVLLHRGGLANKRNPQVLQARIGQTLVSALLIGFIFFRLDKDVAVSKNGAANIINLNQVRELQTRAWLSSGASQSDASLYVFETCRQERATRYTNTQTPPLFSISGQSGGNEWHIGCHHARLRQHRL